MHSNSLVHSFIVLVASLSDLDFLAFIFTKGDVSVLETGILSLEPGMDDRKATDSINPAKDACFLASASFGTIWEIVTRKDVRRAKLSH